MLAPSWLRPVALGCLAAAAVACRAGPLPNVLLISIDTLRADHLSLYGYPQPTTPELDEFARDALVFERSYSTSTWTLPSHGTLLTGLVPDQHGLRRIEDRLSEAVPTVAERLRAAGYRTAAITDGGFLGPQWGFARGFDTYEVTPGQAWEPKDVATLAGRARQWLGENGERGDRPFFLFVHTYEVHQPYCNREGYGDPLLDPGYRGPFADCASVSDAPLLGPDELGRVIGLYDSGIRRADHYLGALLRSLRELDLDDETAVLITSDHGEEFREHGQLEHAFGKVFDENLLVPLILRPPGGTGGGGPRRIATPVSGLDVAPTLLALARAAPPAPGPGRSLLDVAAEPQGRRTLLMQGLSSLADRHELRYRLDRGHRTVIVDPTRGDAVLYDRRRDPKMQQPLSGDPNRGVVLRMQEALAWLSPGAAAACLPRGLTAVTAPVGDGWTPLGMWQGLRWIEAPPAAGRSWRAELEPQLRACLIFATAGDRDPSLRVEGEVAGDLRLDASRLRALPAAGEAPWSPLAGSPPEPAAVFRTAERHVADRAHVDLPAKAELRALGYVE